MEHCQSGRTVGASKPFKICIALDWAAPAGPASVLAIWAKGSPLEVEEPDMRSLYCALRGSPAASFKMKRRCARASPQ